MIFNLMTVLSEPNRGQQVHPASTPLDGNNNLVLGWGSVTALCYSFFNHGKPKTDFNTLIGYKCL